MEDKDITEMLCDYENYRECFKDDPNDPFCRERKPRKSPVTANPTFASIAVKILLALLGINAVLWLAVLFTR